MNEINTYNPSYQHQTPPPQNSTKQEQKEIKQGAIKEEDDTLKFEIDTKKILDETYNQWLGRSINEIGVWEEDKHKKPMMKKELADKLISDLRLKISPQSLISVYDEKLINEIAWETAEKWNLALRFTSADYDLSNEDYMRLVTNIIPYLLVQLLNMSLHGFNQKLRTERGRIMITKNENNMEGGL